MTETAIDLSELPVPEVVETLDTQTIFRRRQADLTGLVPSIGPVLDNSAEPLTKSLLSSSYIETLVRGRINDASKQVFLASAEGANLDQLGALVGVTRRVLDPGDPDANPPVLATLENDDDFRAAIQQAPAAQSVAGPIQAYIFHGLRADARVKDIGAISPNPSEVTITVLSREGNGTPSDALLGIVEAALGADDRRPLGIEVTFNAAQIINYAIEATLTVGTGPDAGNVGTAALSAVNNYADEQHRLGGTVRRSAIIAALHQPGVLDVNLISPAADVIAGPQSAPYQSNPNITVT